MAKKRKEKPQTSEKLPDSSMEEMEELTPEFDFDDEIEDDDGLFEALSFKDDDDSADLMLSDEPDEDELGDLDEGFSENSKLDSLPLADDPVRMYLKEIGQVPLLDTNREMWLSIQIASENLLQTFIDRLSSLREGREGGLPLSTDIVVLAFEHLAENWQAVLTSAETFKLPRPELVAIAN